MASAVPFFVTGLEFSIVFARESANIPRLYGADLAGGALACLGTVPLLNWLGGPNTVLFAGMMAAVAGAVWATTSGTRKLTASLATVLMVAIAANNSGRLIDVVYAKGILRDASWVEFARWNAISRVEVDRQNGGLSIGSGVTIARSVVVTNCHVTRDAAAIRISDRGDCGSAYLRTTYARKGWILVRRSRPLACLGFIFGGCPYVFFDIHEGLTERRTFGLKQFALQAGIRFANQQFSAVADNAMPGNAFSGGACGHRTASTAGSSTEPESFRKSPVSDNPPTRNSFHKRIHRSPRHFFFRPAFPSDRQIARWYHQIAWWHQM